MRRFISRELAKKIVNFSRLDVLGEAGDEESSDFVMGMRMSIEWSGVGGHRRLIRMVLLVVG